MKRRYVKKGKRILGIILTISLIMQNTLIFANAETIGEGEMQTETEQGSYGEEVQWNLEMVNSTGIECILEEQQSDIVVAVLDSGISYSTDMNVVKSVNFVEVDEEIEPFYEDVSGHGTSVASVIGAYARENDTEDEITVQGVNPGVTLYSVRVLDDDNKSSIGRIVQGLDWCIENNVDIVNMSFGVNQNSRVLHDAIRRAKEKGLLLIAAAGNGNQVQYPAAYDEVVSVGSIDVSGEKVDEITNINDIDISAPGQQVPATGFLDMITEESGTSMAAPHVTGAASILWSLAPDKSADFIKNLLIASTKTAEDGTRVLDIAYAVEHLDDALETVDGDDEVVIDENEEDIEDCSDLMVNALWASSDHENTVTNIGNAYTYIPAEAISCIKKGVKMADVSPCIKNDVNPSPGSIPSNQAYMEGKHSFHGLYNFVASTMYLGRIAISLRTLSDSTNNPVQTAMNLTSFPVINTNNSSITKHNNTVSHQINTVLSQFDTNSFWSSVGIDITNTGSGSNSVNARKAYFILGLSVHTAMDAYAHRAFVYNGTSWVSIKEVYGTSAGDNKTIIPERWVSAKKVAKNIISTFWNNGLVQSSVFHTPKEYPYDDLTMSERFKLVKFRDYILSTTNLSNDSLDTWYNNRTH